jgi:hypothetical protein
MRPVPDRPTRRPTGLPSWPMLLLAGSEKSGKSWSCAEASGSELVGRTFWIGIGEDDPDEYGAVPGADFEIVPHDGSYRDVLAAVTWAAQQPSVDGKPNLLVLDSMTRLWELLCDMAQDQANQRARRKAQNPGTKQAAAGIDEEADIHMDLWNIAKDRWAHMVDAVRSHQGPSLLTARLEEVTVVVKGKPTQDKALKVKAEKSLPYDVGGIVQMPERGAAFLVGVRSARLQVPTRMPLPGFTVDKLWRQLGLHEVRIGQRRHAQVSANDTARVALINEVAIAADRAGVSREDVARQWAEAHGGQHIKEATDLGGLEVLRDDLIAQAEQRQNGTVAA